MRVPRIDGQGDFGSMDPDPPAAMRYTEARLARAANFLLEDLDKDTVDFQPNYDASEREPQVLPARFPNLLVNGAGGIAVGMATNIPPHNLGEVVDAALALLDDPDVSDDALLDIVPGPDFPTGGEIMGRTAPRNALRDGRGSVVVRGRASVEEIRKDREAIVVTELPYQVNKQTLIERIAEMVREKRLEGISDVRDESDRQGMRIVIELKRDASGDVILNQLWRYTAMQSSFGVNMLALNHGRPEQMGLRQLLLQALQLLPARGGGQQGARVGAARSARACSGRLQNACSPSAPLGQQPAATNALQHPGPAICPAAATACLQAPATHL